MINVITEEYAKGDLAIRTIVVTFFKIPIYKYRKESTNRQAVNMLTVSSDKQLKIKGFNETED